MNIKIKCIGLQKKKLKKIIDQDQQSLGLLLGAIINLNIQKDLIKKFQKYLDLEAINV